MRKILANYIFDLNLETKAMVKPSELTDIVVALTPNSDQNQSLIQSLNQKSSESDSEKKTDSDSEPVSEPELEPESGLIVVLLDTRL